MVLFGGGFTLSSLGLVILLKFPQQPKTHFQVGRLSGNALIYLQYIDFDAWLAL